MIGPFWLTLSTAALIGAMGPLYGHLLKQPLTEYFPYLAVGFIVWQLMSGIAIESCQAFIAAEGLIKQSRLPLTVHVLRVIWRNVIVFSHNFLVLVGVVLLMGVELTWRVILFPLGMAFLLINAVWAGLVLGVVSARFRDVPQIVASALQVGLFLTPIMWKPDMLMSDRWVAEYNPLFHFIEIMRAPLLGYSPDAISYWIVGVMTVSGWVISILGYARLRSRIAYWV